MRILLIIAGLPAGGAERQVLLLAAGLAKQGCIVRILIFNSVKKIHYTKLLLTSFEVAGLEINRTHSRLKMAKTILKGITHHVNEFQPDIIHSTLHVANIFTRVYSIIKNCQIPLITSIRSDFEKSYSRKNKLIETVLMAKSDVILVNSPRVKQQLQHIRTYKKPNVECVSNGVDPSFFMAGQVRKTQNFSDRCKMRQALIIGRFEEVKNHLTLIRTLKEIDVSVLKKWHFLFVGEGRLESQIKKELFGLPSFEVLKPVNDIIPIYQASRLVILPSLYEGLPNVALEAQACATPVIISPAANESGAVSPHTGWEIDPTAAEELSSVLELPYAEIMEKSCAAYDWALQNFSVDQMVQKTLDVYKGLLK